MRVILILFMVLTSIVDTSNANEGWFMSDNHQHEQELQQQLQQQQHTNSGLEVVILVLSVGCVVVLVLGTAIGSRGRKDAKSTRK